MIILPDHDAAFVHIQKTGGSSITQMLAPYAHHQGERLDGHGWQNGFHDGGMHSGISARYAHLRTFGFVRNPYDRAASYQRNFTEPAKWDRLLAMFLQVDGLTYLGRFERFEEDLRRILGEIGLHPGELPRRLDTTDKRRPITRRWADDIHARYRDDFEILGYEKDSWIEINELYGFHGPY